MPNFSENVNLVANYIRGENENIYDDINYSVEMARRWATMPIMYEPDPINYPGSYSAFANAESIKNMTASAEAVPYGSAPEAVWTEGSGTTAGNMHFKLVDGDAGEKWWVTFGDPDAALGKLGDLALNRISNDIFEKRTENEWTYTGNIKGDIGMGIQPQGEATVAEVNAIDPSTIEGGDVWVMLDGGLLVLGPDGGSLLVEADDWIGWGDSDSNWMNLGQMQGPQGDKGETGDTTNVTVGTTTTLAPGEDATVTTITTGIDIELQFGVPEGEQGDQGDRGERGFTGLRGAAATVDVDPFVIKIAPGGSPTVTNTGNFSAALFQFGIVTGDQGVIGPDGPQGIPGMGVYPQGTATVAEINAFTSDPGSGYVWIMLDSGTITYGSQSVDVVIDDWVGWAAEGYFVNLGAMQGVPGEDGTDGTDGTDGITPTITVGTTSSVEPGTPSTVTDGDVGPNVLLNFQLEKGEVGADGTPGSDGDDGLDGNTPTVTIGTVVGVPSGISPTVTDGDTGPNVLLNFELEKGSDGDIGPKGETGNTGLAATLDVGTTTTVGSSEPADVTNVGTVNDAIFNFEIPQGVQGVKGDEGDQGIQGVVGPVGPEGPLGVSDDPQNLAIISPVDDLIYVIQDVRKENYLGVGEEDGYVLSTTMSGVRSWIKMEASDNSGSGSCSGLEYEIKPIVTPTLVGSIESGKPVSFTIVNYDPLLTYKIDASHLGVVSEISVEGTFTVQPNPGYPLFGSSYTLTIKVYAKDTLAYSFPAISVLTVENVGTIVHEFVNDDSQLNARFITFSNLEAFKNIDFKSNLRYVDEFKDIKNIENNNFILNSSYDFGMSAINNVLKYENVDFSVFRNMHGFTDVENTVTVENVDFALNKRAGTFVSMHSIEYVDFHINRYIVGFISSHIFSNDKLSENERFSCCFSVGQVSVSHSNIDFPTNARFSAGYV